MSYKQDFIRFMVDSGVLTFGKFTLKSGRISPYFMNSGNYKTGAQLAKLGSFYAECIHESGVEFETLFGPAYKGIPLSVATATALYNKYGIDANYCFDRKEAKDHGEGGVIVGKQLTTGEKIIIIEDVVTSGKALREVLPKLKEAADVEIAGMFIQADRMEKGLNSDRSAVQDIKEEFGINIYSIINMDDIIEAIKDEVIPGKEYLDSMKEYRSVYGI